MRLDRFLLAKFAGLQNVEDFKVVNDRVSVYFRAYLGRTSLEQKSTQKTNMALACREYCDSLHTNLLAVISPSLPLITSQKSTFLNGTLYAFEPIRTRGRDASSDWPKMIPSINSVFAMAEDIIMLSNY